MPKYLRLKLDKGFTKEQIYVSNISIRNITSHFLSINSYFCFSRIGVSSSLDISRHIPGALFRYLPTVEVPAMADSIPRLQDDRYGLVG